MMTCELVVSTPFAVLNECGLVWITWRSNILKKLLAIIHDHDPVQHWSIQHEVALNVLFVPDIEMTVIG